MTPSGEDWQLPENPAPLDVNLMVAVLGSVSKKHHVEYDEQLSIATRITKSIGYLTYAVESGFLNGINVDLKAGQYSVWVYLENSKSNEN